MTMRLLLRLCRVALLSATLARVARADEPAPPPPPPPPPPFLSLPPRVVAPPADVPIAPPPPEAPWEPSKGLLVAGLVTLPVAYGIGATVTGFCNLASCGSNAHDNYLLIPLVGPFVQMSVTQTAAGNVFVASEGLAQVAGAMMIASAYLFPVQRVDADERRHAVRWMVMPTGAAGRSGLSVVGAF